MTPWLNGPMNQFLEDGQRTTNQEQRSAQPSGHAGWFKTKNWVATNAEGNSMKVTLAAVFLVMLSWGCGGKSELSRSKAKKLIEGSENPMQRIEEEKTYEVAIERKDRAAIGLAVDKLSPGATLGISPQTVANGMRQGLWVASQYHCIDVTFKGGKYFVAGSYCPTAASILTPEGYKSSGPNAGMIELTVAKTIKRHIIEVTGISDAPAMVGTPGTVKVAAFTWKWDRGDLPSELRSYVVDADIRRFERLHDSKALFQLYDDGWRFEGQVH